MIKTKQNRWTKNFKNRMSKIHRSTEQKTVMHTEQKINVKHTDLPVDKPQKNK